MMERKEAVLIIGLDEQGLFLSLLFSRAHYSVVAFDVDKNKTLFLNKGYYDKKIYGLDGIFSLYRGNIIFSSSENDLKKDYSFIVLNQIKEDRLELLDRLSLKPNTYLLLTDVTLIQKNQVFYSLLKEKKVHIINWPIIKDQKETFKQVFHPNIVLIGLREDQEHLTMLLLLELLYKNVPEIIYTDIYTSAKTPLLIENYLQLLQTFFKEQLGKWIRQNESTEDLIYILEKLEWTKNISLYKRKKKNQLSTKELLDYEEKVDENTISSFYQIIRQQKPTKIAFLGAESPFIIEQNDVLLLIKVLAEDNFSIWFYDDENMIKVKAALAHKVKIHYASKIEEALKEASIVIVGSYLYSMQNIQADYLIDLTKYIVKKAFKNP